MWNFAGVPARRVDSHIVAIGLFLIWLLLVVIGAFNSDSSSY